MTPSPHARAHTRAHYETSHAPYQSHWHAETCSKSASLQKGSVTTHARTHAHPCKRSCVISHVISNGHVNASHAIAAATNCLFVSRFPFPLNKHVIAGSPRLGTSCSAQSVSNFPFVQADVNKGCACDHLLGRMFMTSQTPHDCRQ